MTAASGLAFGRRHALFLGLLACGAALRLEVALAYKPALIIDDSQGFLGNAEHLRPDELHPMGYAVFLWLLDVSHGLARVALAQHVIGLAIALLIYVLLQRLGVRRWASALAAAPVLLDAYLLDLEQFILAETLFELLLVATCAALLWRRRPGMVEAGIAGLLCAATALTRPNGMVVIAPAAPYAACSCAGADSPRYARCCPPRPCCSRRLPSRSPATRSGSTASTAPTRSPVTAGASSTGG